MQRLRRGGVHIISSSKARTMVTSSPSRLNAGSSSSWLQHSLPMLAVRGGGGGGGVFLVERGLRRGGTWLKASFLSCGISYGNDPGYRSVFLVCGVSDMSLLSFQAFVLCLWVLVVEASLSIFHVAIIFSWVLLVGDKTKATHSTNTN